MEPEIDLSILRRGIPCDPLPQFDPEAPLDPSVPHAPPRPMRLEPEEKKRALRNALRYFPSELHSQLAKEFARELEKYGHIYMHRFRPRFPMRAYPTERYPARCQSAAGVQMLIMNNLDPRVAQYPHELVSHANDGQVFSNWAQFWLTMKYLSEMDEEQTLLLSSGIPLGLFRSSPRSPRVVITNGLVVPSSASREMSDKLFAMGVTNKGHSSAGSFTFVGPQGPMHLCSVVLQNVARKKLNTSDLTGRVLVSSGLGGMSCTQAKAAQIAGLTALIAEVNPSRVEQSRARGLVNEVALDVERAVQLVREWRRTKRTGVIVFQGNSVALLRRLREEQEKRSELLVDLITDGSGTNNIDRGGYIPEKMSPAEVEQMARTDPDKLKRLVHESLRSQVESINALVAAGAHFFELGNHFLEESARAGADVLRKGAMLPLKSDERVPREALRYESYVQAGIGDVLSLGFGPIRLIATSGRDEDLRIIDDVVKKTIIKLTSARPMTDRAKQLYEDNLKWIDVAARDRLSVGAPARVLWADLEGRLKIAFAINDEIAARRLRGSVWLSRDHHDVSASDSPQRETSDINDGSAPTADMSMHNALGLSHRGASVVAMHNGGGVGWGESSNGGYMLLLDGSHEAKERARLLIEFDVSNGLARRSFSGNEMARKSAERAMTLDPKLRLTLPSPLDPTTDALLERLVAGGR